LSLILAQVSRAGGDGVIGLGVTFLVGDGDDGFRIVGLGVIFLVGDGDDGECDDGEVNINNMTTSELT